MAGAAEEQLCQTWSRERPQHWEYPESDASRRTKGEGGERRRRSLLEDGEGEVEERGGRKVMVEDGGSCRWLLWETLEAMETHVAALPSNLGRRAKWLGRAHWLAAGLLRPSVLSLKRPPRYTGKGWSTSERAKQGGGVDDSDRLRAAASAAAG